MGLFCVGLAAFGMYGIWSFHVSMICMSASSIIRAESMNNLHKVLLAIIQRH